MAFPYLELFGVLLLLYMGYSFWERLDPRYPVGAALVLLVATALTEAVGATAQADTLAEYVFLLLVGGVVLMLLDRVRPALPTPPPSAGGAGVAEQESSDATNEGKGSSQQLLDDLEQQPVPPVDAPGRHDDEDEQSGDPEPDDRKAPVRDDGVEDTKE
jgi:hypothetical protein